MASESVRQHQAAASGRGPVACAIITVSDTRTPETDTSGAAMRERLESAGHRVVFYRIVKDEPEQIVALLDSIIDQAEAQVVLLNGGTGISSRDTTYDALARKLEKTLPGFGELFRMLSYAEIGAAAMLSRATAGVYRGRLIFSTPGSSNAVKLAMERLIVPELEHLAWELTR
ncbi:MAG: MogA/MoaB family molybdenum cofactor biosynthesis protein [Actinomycetota bacterium]